ncbi:metal-dependent hydrolase [Natronorubrum tibetense]|uniref:Membrane-bound metal-dependent hydrolase n=1 Tax=Natronorubrum tibetense GA33 TaxID=1114856 RepID=L9VLH0_9EURY|nr:metal-dependent hydrolase [Natronorubrum tibetense]ELY37822.1 hypothetical protein C496_20010 [Natronorubrum tibetense GA33]
MADVLTHVLVGYILGTLLSIRYESLRSAHVTLVMIGALTPDLVKIQLIAPDERVAETLGVAFSWSSLHTFVGSVLLIGLGALLLGPAHRKQAFALFAVGVLSHHILDILLLTPTGEAYTVFWPFLQYRPPAGDLYLSSDRWPALVASCGALLVWIVSRRRDSPTETSAID